MKRNLILIILISLCLFTYAEGSHVLNGIWVSQSGYDDITGNPESSIGYEGSGIRGDSVIEIDIQSDGIGRYWNISPFDIYQVEQQGNNEFVIYISKYDDPMGEVFITLIDEDSIFITHSEGLGLKGNKKYPYFFRFTTSTNLLRQNEVLDDEPLQYGVINDTRVRLRTKPNLECDVFGFLNTGDEVAILDKTTEKQKIDNMEDYWYKVRFKSFPDGFPDGWVYGAFIDIED